jgi:hypothetical protein
VALLENISHFQLTLIANISFALLTLFENRLTLTKNSLQTSVPAHIYCERHKSWQHHQLRMGALVYPPNTGAVPCGPLALPSSSFASKACVTLAPQPPPKLPRSLWWWRLASAS